MYVLKKSKYRNIYKLYFKAIMVFIYFTVKVINFFQISE